MSPQPDPRAGTAFLPSIAYFAAGGGPPCTTLRSALAAAGFTNVQCPSNGEPATQFWITPPGATRRQLSPPGTGPQQAYDLISVIQVMGS